MSISPDELGMDVFSDGVEVREDMMSQVSQVP
jgi:hypothetical protein